MLAEALVNEPELLTLLREGDHHAFSIFYRHYSKPLYYNILSLVKDPAASEELVQEIFSKIWHKHAEIQIHSTFGGYLFQSGRNIVHDFFRRLDREQVLYAKIRNIVTEEYSHVEESLLAKENLDLLQQAINQLSPQRRRAFELCKMDGLSYKQASEVMGISLSTLKDHMAQARESIREYLNHRLQTAITISIFLVLNGF